MNSTTDIDESCFIIADSSDDALKKFKKWADGKLRDGDDLYYSISEMNNFVDDVLYYGGYMNNYGQ